MRIFIRELLKLGADSLEAPHEHRVDEDLNSNAPKLVEDQYDSVGSSDTNTGLQQSTAGKYVVEDVGSGEDEADGDCNSNLINKE